ncbi:MAG: hypothetical protein ROO73_06175 [Roseivirga sp.]
MGLLLLQQASCGSDGGGDGEPTSSGRGSSGPPGKEAKKIDPDKFGLEVQDKTSKNRCFAEVKITPGSAGMKLSELFVTASVKDAQGELKGSGGKSNKGLEYTVDLNDRSLGELWLTGKNGGLGKDNTAFEEGKHVLFKVEYKPAPGTKAGEKYTLTVTVERKGDHPHTETRTEVLKAPRDVSKAKNSDKGKSKGKKST